jgi:DNA-binding MarR family transcriptional regulator
VTDSQRILDSIRRLVRLLRLSDRVAQRELGLSAAQLFVLQELGKTPALSLSEVAERTRTDQSSVSVVVTRLVGRGHVARDRDPRDGRRLRLNLTKSGRAIVQKAPPPEELGAEKGAAPMLFEDETRLSARRTRKK